MATAADPLAEKPEAATTSASGTRSARICPSLGEAARSIAGSQASARWPCFASLMGVPLDLQATLCEAATANA
jgi:hypothetical protein